MEQPPMLEVIAFYDDLEIIGGDQAIHENPLEQVGVYV